MDEYQSRVKKLTLRELINECIQYANDGYYRDLFDDAYEELDKRLKMIEEQKNEQSV